MFIVARQPYLSLRPFMGGMISLLPELEAIALVVAITSRHYVAKISPVNTNVLIRRLAAVIKYCQYPFSAVFLFSAFSASESLEP
jgi:hypothetical protein